MHLNSGLLFEKYAKTYFKQDSKVLEIGPFGYPSSYNKIVNMGAQNWHTLDIGAEYISDAAQNPLHSTSESEYKYPFDDETFDIVLSGQVMEHVKSLWEWLDELKRITRKGGIIIIISPISWEYHEAPVDCWRIYPEGMKALLDWKNLTPLVNRFESLEVPLIPASTPTIPGKSSIDLNQKPGKFLSIVFLINRILAPIPGFRRFRIPVQAAYDNICIAQC